MRELDLQRTLFGLGAAAEDFQDQAGPVEHLGAPGLLEIALLDRPERTIHHHELDVMTCNQTQDLVYLALAKIGGRPNPADWCTHRFGHNQIDRLRQTRGLVQASLEITR